LPSLQRVQTARYLEEFTEQAQASHKQMADNQQRRQKHLDGYSQMVRGEARWWYRASLLSAAVAFGVFIYAVAFRVRSSEALSYLTPLYTLLPGVLSALFFNQYAQANRRVDEERDRVWTRVEEFEQRRMGEIEAIRVQLQKDNRV